MDRNLSFRFNASTDEIIAETSPPNSPLHSINWSPSKSMNEIKGHRRNSSTLTQESLDDYYEVDNKYFGDYEDDEDATEAIRNSSCYVSSTTNATRNRPTVMPVCTGIDDSVLQYDHITAIVNNTIAPEDGVVSSSCGLSAPSNKGVSATSLPDVINTGKAHSSTQNSSKNQQKQNKESKVDRFLRQFQDSFAPSSSSSSVVYSNSKLPFATSTPALPSSPLSSPSATERFSTPPSQQSRLPSPATTPLSTDAITFVSASGNLSLSGNCTNNSTNIHSTSSSPQPPSTSANTSPVNTEVCQLLDSLQEAHSASSSSSAAGPSSTKIITGQSVICSAKDAKPENGMDRWFAEMKSKFATNKDKKIGNNSNVEGIGGTHHQHRKLSNATDNVSPSPSSSSTNLNNNSLYYCKPCASKRTLLLGNSVASFNPPPPPPSPSVSSSNLAAQASAGPSSPILGPQAVCLICHQDLSEHELRSKLTPTPPPLAVTPTDSSTLDRSVNALLSTLASHEENSINNNSGLNFEPILLGKKDKDKKKEKEKDKKKNLFQEFKIKDKKKEGEKKEKADKENLFSALFNSKSNANNGKNGSPIHASRSSSAENLPAEVKPTKSIKMTSSKSTIAFSKRGFEESDDEVEMLDTVKQAMFLKPLLTNNPTLRRRHIDERQGSPTPDLQSPDGDRISVSSRASSTAPEESRSNVHSQTIMAQICAKTTCWKTLINYTIGTLYIFFFVSSIGFGIFSPLPSFINGLLIGVTNAAFVMLATLCLFFTNYYFVKPDEDNEVVNIGSKRLSEAVSISRKKMSLPGLSIDTGSFTGWVYEFLGDYEQREVNGFKSRLVFVVLQGHQMYILVPIQEVTEKRLKQITADSKTYPAFGSQRIIDFRSRNREVQLLLTKNVRNQRKYCWSKKYPVCFRFSDEEGYVTKGPESDPDADIRNPETNERKFVFFPRSCRDKEEWFWAIKAAIDQGRPYSRQNSPKGSQTALFPTDLLPLAGDVPGEIIGSNIDEQQGLKYLHIMTRRMNYATFMRENILNADFMGSGGIMKPLTWFNVLMNRLSFDMLTKPNWSAYIAKKLQRKLRKVRLPEILDGLNITEIDVGSQLPKFNSIPSPPSVDDAGLWIDFDISYSGGFTMTLETKLKNLIKDLNENTIDSLEFEANNPVKQPAPPKPWNGYKYKRHGGGEECTVDEDSDIDSIVTSSEDEDPEIAPADPEDADTDMKQKKFNQVFDKIRNNTGFQKVMQIDFFRKPVEGLAQTSFFLTVTITEISGIITLNIPESPTDRLWYGFRAEPTFQIKAQPKFGDHNINVTAITNSIEKKLRQEFFNYFVLPHMDDIFIPALNANIEQHVSVVP